jgi:hypothetical protein
MCTSVIDDKEEVRGGGSKGRSLKKEGRVALTPCARVALKGDEAGEFNLPEG